MTPTKAEAIVAAVEVLVHAGFAPFATLSEEINMNLRSAARCRDEVVRRLALLNATYEGTDD